MRLCFTPSAWEDYLWFEENDRKLLKRINLLIKEVMRNPHDGIGKPEALRGDLSGSWSRRINDEHRLIYFTTATEVVIIACRYHTSV